MSTLVTGADGFVGEHLLTHLLGGGEPGLTASAQKLPPTRSTLSPSEIAEVDWKAADVRDHDALFRVLAAARPDRVYHLAGFASGALAREKAGEALNVNAGGTVNLCEAVLAAQEQYPEFDPRILVACSGDAYGDAGGSHERFREDMDLRPVSVYGLSKACQELAAHTYRRAKGLRALVSRGFNLIGPGQQRGFVVPDFCAQAAAIQAGRQDPPIRVGNLDVERDFMDVRDGVRALAMIMDLESPQGAYNVCSGEGTSIRQLLDWILDEAGLEVEVVVDPEKVREEEEPWVVGDPTRLKEQTGWEPVHDVEETVREVYRAIAD